ncbi:MAG: hypothetical protein H0U75_12805 [Legionella sp.]|nr:hypothetical protein [Legionella sp.]
MTSHFEISNLPYLLIAKDTQSRFLALSKPFAALLGWKSCSQAISKTDYDIPCRAAEFAHNFIAMDKKILSQQRNILSLDIIFYASGWKVLLTERTVLKNEAEDMIGITAHCMDVSTTKAYEPYLLDHKIHGKDLSAASYILSDAYCPLPLTAKQQRCLFLLVRGKTTKEIGKILDISPRTVEDHMNAIKNKLNCQSKSELIEKAIENGFLYYVPKSFKGQCN